MVHTKKVEVRKEQFVFQTEPKDDGHSYWVFHQRRPGNPLTMNTWLVDSGWSAGTRADAHSECQRAAEKHAKELRPDG